MSGKSSSATWPRCVVGLALASRTSPTGHSFRWARWRLSSQVPTSLRCLTWRHICAGAVSRWRHGRTDGVSSARALPRLPGAVKTFRCGRRGRARSQRPVRRWPGPRPSAARRRAARWPLALVLVLAGRRTPSSGLAPAVVGGGRPAGRGRPTGRDGVSRRSRTRRPLALRCCSRAAGWRCWRGGMWPGIVAWRARRPGPRARVPPACRPPACRPRVCPPRACRSQVFLPPANRPGAAGRGQRRRTARGRTDRLGRRAWGCCKWLGLGALRTASPWLTRRLGLGGRRRVAGGSVTAATAAPYGPWTRTAISLFRRP